MAQGRGPSIDFLAEPLPTGKPNEIRNRRAGASGTNPRHGRCSELASIVLNRVQPITRFPSPLRTHHNFSFLFVARRSLENVFTFRRRRGVAFFFPRPSGRPSHTFYEFRPE
jgi:hypothetical protein